MYTSPATAALADQHEAHVAAMDAFLPWWEDAEVENSGRYVDAADIEAHEVEWMRLTAQVHADTDAHNQF